MTSHRRTKWIIAICVLAVACIIWKYSSDVVESKQTPTPHTEKVSVSEQLPATPVVDEGPANRLPVTASPSIQSAPTAKRTKIEVCGAGTIELDTLDKNAVDEYTYSLIKDVILRWAQALRQSPDNRARAMGLVVQIRNEQREASDAINRNLTNCQAADESCQTRLRHARAEVFDHANPELMRDLVGLATKTRDPAIYALTAGVCRTYFAEPIDIACQSISMDEWLSIDPDNAVPWFAQAEMANATRDLAGRTNALERAASTHKIEGYSDAFYRAARTAIPNNISQLERVALIRELYGFGISRSTIMRSVACTNPEAVNDSRRHQICDALAELMVTKGTTLFDKSLGVDIGQHLGWPMERVDQLIQEREALFEALYQGMYGKDLGDSMNPFSCEAIRGQNAFFDKLATVGEIGAARDFLASSGSSVEELARKRKSRLEDINRANRMRQEIEAPPITP